MTLSADRAGNPLIPIAGLEFDTAFILGFGDQIESAFTFGVL
jgi:hypothetical protein